MDRIRGAYHVGQSSESVALEHEGEEGTVRIELESLGLVQKILKLIVDTKKVVSMIVINRTEFLMMAFHLAEMRPLLERLSKEQEFLRAHPTWPALQHLADVLEAMYTLAQSCTLRSRIFLLYHCNDLLDEINKHFSELVHCLNSMLTSNLDLPLELKELVLAVQEKLKSAVFFQEPGHGELAREISLGLSKGYCDEFHATSLLRKIADHLKVPEFEAAELKLELQNDLEAAEAEGREDAHELKSLYRLLCSAQVLDEKRRLASFDSPLHDAGIPPIPSSFFCPITGALMHEPVMVAEEGYTYEKSAILEWFGRGHRTCPDTGKELESLELIPNLKLQQALDEFLDHMYQAQMVYALQELRKRGMGTSVEQAIHTVKRLSDLGPKYKQLVVSLDGVQPLVALLKPSVPHIREIILRVLSNIAALGDEPKISIIEAEAVPVVLGILQRKPVENGGPVQLLWELSKIEAGKKAIVSVKGSILIIATALNLCSNNDRLQIENLLNNLCQYDTSVIIEAARSTFFGPLVSCLTHGNERTKLEIVTAVSTSLELNDHSSVALVKAGIVPPLLNLLQHGSAESIQAAAKALRQLSITEINKMSISKAGAIPVLVKFLGSPLAHVKVDVTAILSNLATDSQNAHEIDQEGAVTRLFGMLRSRDAVLQEYSLKTLQFMAKDSQTVRARVMELKMVPSIYILLQSVDLSANCRRSILNLLCHIAEDRESRQAVVTSGENVKSLIQLLDGNIIVEEKEAVFGILAALSKIEEMKPRMVSERKLLMMSADFLSQGSSKIQEHSAVLLSKLADPGLVETSVQMALSKQGVIVSLKDMISDHSSTERAKKHAAATLYLFSMCTPSLTVRQSIVKKVLAKMGIRKFKPCKVHAGKCSVKGTFCLVKAGAIPPLINLIKEGGPRSAEWAVEALYTLVTTDENAQRGVDFLVKNDILSPLVALVGRDESSTEKAVRMLEKIFKVKKYRDDKYSGVAKSILFTTVATGKADARKAAATALMHLGMIPRNSTYAYTGTT